MEERCAQNYQLQKMRDNNNRERQCFVSNNRIKGSRNKAKPNKGVYLPLRQDAAVRPLIVRLNPTIPHAMLDVREA